MKGAQGSLRSALLQHSVAEVQGRWSCSIPLLKVEARQDHPDVEVGKPSKWQHPEVIEPDETRATAGCLPIMLDIGCDLRASYL